MCGYFTINELQKGKWLGDQFTDSLKPSVTATIKDIEGKVRRALYEIGNIVKDFNTQRSPAVRELRHPQLSRRSTVSARTSSCGWFWPQA